MKKIIFLHTGWMNYFQGLKGDIIRFGGSFVDEHGYGHEMYNFQDVNGKMYGYVQAPGNGTININRLGANEEDENIKNVDVYWMAKHPSGGVCITGYYKNATVYRYWQNKKLRGKRKKYGYYVEADSKNCSLIHSAKRFVKVPTGKGGKGRSFVWYADSNIGQNFIKKLPSLLSSSKKPKKKRTIDPEKNKRVEEIAVETVKKYYSEFEIIDVQNDNVGWDLTIRNDDNEIFIEVKGLSGKDLQIELTPNEYHHMQKLKSKYRVAIVSQSLSKKPKFTIFQYFSDCKKWLNDKNTQLKIKEKIAARCFA
ncbi:DUF3883 domain-containing protein [uncultured Desulfosarcina sp.]|uniref:DUF3883 domain-containing protein n=1 Tax=uncultured Desulfosarcina sp. TaxID=218289 RepID=UPI0029C611DE|nr:DUF3883 domain-containing protein [uncultured Desulfosarcina sp.]